MKRVNCRNDSEAIWVVPQFLDGTELQQLHKVIMEEEDFFEKSNLGELEQEHDNTQRHSEYLYIDDLQVASSLRSKALKVFQQIMGQHTLDLYFSTAPSEDNIEPVQLLRYKGMQQRFTLHHDNAELDELNMPSDYAENTPGDNRIATIFVYLNSITEGGSTFFPELHGLANGNASNKQPQKGISIQPQAGNAIVWLNVVPSKHLKQNSPLVLHEAKPLAKEDQTKYGINLWLKDHPMGRAGA